MDSRDITMEIPDVTGKNITGEIMKLQIALLDKYLAIEDMPNYPCNINLKSNQILLKDFVGRVIEELGEAWESYELAFNINRMVSSEYQIIWDNHIQNFNEELSDSIHFFLELLIFSGYQWEGDIIRDYMDGYGDLHHYIPNKDTEVPAFLRGGRIMQAGYRDKAMVNLWLITYHLQLARNCLKNKPWKQSQMLSDKKTYMGHLKKAWEQFLYTMVYFGHIPESLFEIYFRKNQINVFRIRSKY